MNIVRNNILKQKNILPKYPPNRYAMRSNKQEPLILCDKLLFQINKKKGWWTNKHIINKYRKNIVKI